MKLIYVVTAAFAVLVFLKLAAVMLKKGIQKYTYLKKVQKSLPLFEIVLWTAFTFWAVRILFKDGTLYPYMVAGLLAILAVLFTWFVFRDIVAGAIFRVQNDLNKGDYIKVGELSGQIKSISLTHLEMVSDKGQTVKIPFSRLNKELISGMTTPEGIEEYTIHLAVNKGMGKAEIEDLIKREIANSPWCNYKNPPVIKLRDEVSGMYHYDVMVYALNHQHLRKVEGMLQEKFGA